MKNIASIAGGIVMLLGVHASAFASAALFVSQCRGCHGQLHPLELVYNAAGNAAIIGRVNSLGMGAVGSVADHASIAAYLDTIKPTINLAPVAHDSPGTRIDLRDIRVSAAQQSAFLKIIGRIETVTPPTKGTVTYQYALGFDTPSQVVYKPFPGKSGVDTWTYRGIAIPAQAGFDTTVRTASVVIAPAANAPNYTALWWKSPAASESGWGLNLVHQGDILFATWFTYDLDGSGLWISSDLHESAANAFSGTLYQSQGSPFNSTAYDSSRFTAVAVGSATLAFSDASNGTFTYTLKGVTQSRPITRFAYSSPVPTCTFGGDSSTNYQDLWWRSPPGSENGWGVNITHQGDILFATWFTYGADGTDTWMVMDAATRVAEGIYRGSIYRTTSAPFNAYDASRFNGTSVGTGTFTFTDGSNGTFSYTVDGVAQSKPITRYVFSSPVNVCR
jgi:hypothetical protein